ncbi:peptidase S24/S26A/S26B/S26C [Scleroderma citrinum]
MKRVLRVLYWSPLPLAFTQYFYTVKTIRGRSMQPTFNPDTSTWNDIVVFDRTSVKSGSPVSRGDIISLKNPTDDGKTLIKRVVAVAGDTIKTLPPYPLNEVVVPEGHIWVEGDQPFRSLDSNSFGPIPLALVDAKPCYIVWPLHRLGPLKGSTPLAANTGVSRNPNISDAVAEQRRVAEAAFASKRAPKDTDQ